MHDQYKNRLYIFICTHRDLNKVLFMYMCIHEDENNILFISMCMHEDINAKPMKPLWTIDGLARFGGDAYTMRTAASAMSEGVKSGRRLPLDCFWK